MENTIKMKLISNLPEEIVYQIFAYVDYDAKIVYYLDKFNNVYNTEDIMNEIKNPKIIAKYQMHNDKYSIPEFGLV